MRIKWSELRTLETRAVLQDLLCSLRVSKLSSLRRRVKSLGAREGALECVREGALEGALDGALVPFDTLDLALEAVSSSSAGAASSLGARLGASEGSRCRSGR